jgi:phthalate 4,5-dioxygenase oxygenase subunit
MMSPEQNELMTRVGPGTKCGALMRHYWHPVALADELPAERPAKPVRVLGQDFVLFRDERGRHGLLDRDCPHRGADLAFGRLEDGGLRCACSMAGCSTSTASAWRRRPSRKAACSARGCASAPTR